MVTRRQFIGALGTLSAESLRARELSASTRRVSEWSLSSSKPYNDPFNDVNVDVVVSGPSGDEKRIPAFWAGEQTWKVRYSPKQPGRHTYRTECSDASNNDLRGVTGAIEAAEYGGSNELYRRGPLRTSKNKRYLEHADGTPFFWLGDTWWMGLVERLRWPEDFRELAADRSRKGFNVIQIVAGLYPDMAPLDPRGANEAGLPWERDFQRINPGFDMADLRIQHLIDVGLMPCILGCWGYYLGVMGAEKMQRHWRYLIARWGAYPVVWCLAGEGSMPWYLSKRKPSEQAELERGWTEMARYVRATDPFRRLITVHPSRAGRDVVTDPAVLDFDMLQTGHNDYASIPRTVNEVTKARSRQPLMPVINSEVCYEGILGRSRHDIQRFVFWASVLSGTCGFTYGANGVWQVNLPARPFGPSPHGRNWGNTPWREAANYAGSGQLGAGAKMLRRLPWHEVEPHPEWVTPHWTSENYELPYAAGIPRRLRIVYVPTMWDPPKLTALESGVSYRATLFNPSSGEEKDMGKVQADERGEHKLGFFPYQRDWVVVLEAA